MATRSASLAADTVDRGKPGFANRVASFAKLAARLPGFPMLWVASLAVAVVLTVTGAFNSAALPVPRRILFWVLLMGWTAIKWQVWFAFTVHRPRDWPRASVIGAVLLNLSLPIEIPVVLALIGVRGSANAVEIWLRAAIVSLAIFPVMALAAWRLRKAAAAPTPPASAPKELLKRVRFDPASLLAIEAEDHYCRLRLTDGTSRLVHFRFGDALADVAGLDGCQVHRGRWVAASAIAGAAREGRRWQLLLTDGSRAPVSTRHHAAVKARGWLAAPARSGVAIARPSA